MFERFTEQARQVVVFAQEEARALGHDSIGTEHLLLGILRNQGSVAERALDRLDVTLEEMRMQVVRVAPPDEQASAGEMPFRPRAKQTLELALREALADEARVGPEHVLLGLVALPESTAARILRDFDVDADTVRRSVLSVTSGFPPRPDLSGWVGPPPQFDFNRLADLRKRRRDAEARGDKELVAALREEESEMFAEALTGAGDELDIQVASSMISPAPERRPASTIPLVVAIVLAAAGFPVGLLVGFLIWG